MLRNRVIKNVGKTALALIVALALMNFLPAKVQADGAPVNLMLGGEGATSWSIVNIQPGDSGTKTVTLHNAGNRRGSVTIWISDIVSSEGENPEPETGDTAEPGELADYLLFNINHSRLSTNLSLPTTIANFPQSLSSSKYIKISRLNAGETISLDWVWELPAETGNEIQGDSLSFTINYMLEELPSSGSGGYGGGYGGGGSWDSTVPPQPQPLLLVVDVCGRIAMGGITQEGVLKETVEAASPDGALVLLLPQGTRLLDYLGNPLGSIEVRFVTPPETPSNRLIVGQCYCLQPNCKFDPPIKFILHYDSQALGDDMTEENLSTAYYEQRQQEWILMPTVVDTEANTATASLSHSSIFSMLVEPLAVAGMPMFNARVCNLSVTPSQVNMWGPLPFAVKTGEGVTVTADVVNDGDQGGDYTIILKLNGATRATQEITLGPKQSKQVDFMLYGIKPGHYKVELNELSVEFVSSLWFNWWLIGGTVATLMVMSWFIIWFLGKMRRSTVTTPWIYVFPKSARNR